MTSCTLLQVSAAFKGDLHFFWQPCYAFPRGMGAEARRLSATRHPLAVQGVSGVQGSLRDKRKGLRSAKAFDKGFRVGEKSQK